jgi:hypothetical protein
MHMGRFKVTDGCNPGFYDGAQLHRPGDEVVIIKDENDLWKGKMPFIRTGPKPEDKVCALWPLDAEGAEMAGWDPGKVSRVFPQGVPVIDGKPAPFQPPAGTEQNVTAVPTGSPAPIATTAVAPPPGQPQASIPTPVQPAPAQVAHPAAQVPSANTTSPQETPAPVPRTAPPPSTEAAPQTTPGVPGQSAPPGKTPGQ